MGVIQAYRMAVKSIVSNKIRSFLTMLGVIIGVGAVIAAIAFAQGSTSNITKSIQGLGTNLIQINITGRNSNRNITYQELADFADKNSSEINAIAPQTSGQATIKSGTKTWDTTALGTSPEYEEIKNIYVQSGRFLLSFDLDYRQKVVILGPAVVKNIFGSTDPVGEKVKINGQVFRVIGVLEEKSSSQDKSEDDQVIIPVTVAQRLMRSTVIRNFSVEAASAEAVDSVMVKLNSLLTRIYKDTRTFRVFNQEQMLSVLGSVTGMMAVVLGGIATISLVVGGIGIMNIMLVSVTERTREIGIRKAVGAKKKNILVQFLIEALIVTGIGGIIGVLLGLFVIHFILGGFKIVPEVYSVPWILLAFGISLFVGIVFGMFPAYKASNLNPIEALRFE